MSDPKMAALARKMRGMDFCMLATVSSYGRLASRPMSNNGEVEYNGTSYFFTWANARMTRDIEDNKHVMLNFKSDKGFLFVAVQGEARVLHDRRVMAEHWHKVLESGSRTAWTPKVW